MLEKIKSDMNDDILRIACEYIDVDFDNMLFISGFDDFLYSFKKDKEYILRLSHSLHRSSEQVKEELEFLEYLIENNISANVPVVLNTGEFVEVIPFEDKYFTVCCFEKVYGEKINHMNDEFIYNYGKVTGKLHSLAKSYESKLKDIEWHEDMFLENGFDFEDISNTLNKVLTEINNRPKNNENYGLIHSNLSRDNILLNDSDLFILNFGNIKYMYFIYDIAVVLFNMFVIDNPNKDKEMIIRFYELFMEGYNTENILPSEEFYYIELFLELKRIDAYITCITHYDDESRPKWAIDYIKTHKKKINERDHIINLEFNR